MKRAGMFVEHLCSRNIYLHTTICYTILPNAAQAYTISIIHDMPDFITIIRRLEAV